MSRTTFSLAAARFGVVVLIAGLAVCDRAAVWPGLAAENDPAPAASATKPPAKSKSAPVAARHVKHAQATPPSQATGPTRPGSESKQSSESKQVAGEKSQGKEYSAAANVRKIRAALQSPTVVIDFQDFPLQDAIDFLKDYHEIEIQLDKKALDDVGIDPEKDTVKSLHVKGISLRSALNLMLRELDLTYMIENEVLMITTPEEAASRVGEQGSEGTQAEGEKSEGKEYSAAANVRKVQAALQSPTQMEFQETPLQDVLDFLENYHQIDIQIDNKALNDVGIDPATTAVTKHLKGISLRSALRLMLHELDLTYMIENEVLLITTPEEAQQRLLTKFYPVADLVTCRDEKGGLWEDYDQLVETITSTVQPNTWDAVGGPGAIAPGTYSSAKVLVVSQTQEVQEEIAALLRQLRGAITQSGQKPEPPRRDRPAPEPKGHEKCHSETSGMGGPSTSTDASKKK